MQYDQEVTTFSPDGRVFQVEYAEKAGEKAGYAPALPPDEGLACAAAAVWSA